MRVIAIDPGYERLGIAVIEKTEVGKEQLLYSDCFRTPAKEKFEERLFSIGREVERLILEYQPNNLAIENLFLSNNQKTAMRVAEVRGALLYIATKSSLSIKEMTPLQIKLAVTGDGKSSKDQIIRMVHLLLKIPSKKMLDDEYDAIAVGLAYFALHKNL
ncbi:MAG: crossover junction endodeoxyribonuclease RuvC [Patescibacteria group bacterium]